MRVLVYTGVALWISVGVVIFVRILILSAQMMNNLAPKPGPRQFAFQTDPSDYTELGQLYRKKLIRTQLVMLSYVPTLFIAIFIASRV